MKNYIKGQGYQNIFFKIGDTICIVRLGKTSNEKISAPGEKIVQTYHFSKGQFEIAQSKTTMIDFFSNDKDVCFNCPYAVSNGAKLLDCYTHKPRQYSGFLSMLRAVKRRLNWEEIPTLNKETERKILEFSTGRYIRFGTYGEPSLLPIDLTRTICAVAKNWTGYTHQHENKPQFAPYFMASTHNETQENNARLNGWRSFVASKQQISNLISCPASAESGYKSNCSKCGLCSGTQGKGNKSVVILEH